MTVINIFANVLEIVQQRFRQSFRVRSNERIQNVTNMSKHEYNSSNSIKQYYSEYSSQNFRNEQQ